MKTVAFKKLWFPILILILMLTACSSTAESIPVEPTLPAVTLTNPPAASSIPEPTTPPLPSSTPEPTVAPISFDAVTYRDETAGFELDYPSRWALG